MSIQYEFIMPPQQISYSCLWNWCICSQLCAVEQISKFNLFQKNFKSGKVIWIETVSKVLAINSLHDQKTLDSTLNRFELLLVICLSLTRKALKIYSNLPRMWHESNNSSIWYILHDFLYTTYTQHSKVRACDTGQRLFQLWDIPFSHILLRQGPWEALWQCSSSSLPDTG